VAGNLDRRIGRLQQGDHLCLIHESAAEQLAALIPFLKSGLSRGERLLVVGSQKSGNELARALGAAENGGGALVLLGESWLEAGPLDPNSLKDFLRCAEQQALDDGFAGLRVTWDVNWLLNGLGEAGESGWTELEAELNRFLAGSRTSLLCHYARADSPPALLVDVLRTHPFALVGNQMCPNAFYEPPAMILGAAGFEERVDWMIAQIRRARGGEEKLEELTYRLAQKGAALERADRAKEEVLAMLAHELLNPLGTISNAIQILRLKGDRDETWHRAIAAAERQVLHQALLVDDILEVSRVTRGEVELHYEKLDLVELVQETVEGYRPTMRDARLELDLELPSEPLWVRGDRSRLSQALVNLLQNAIKFTPAGGRIAVRARQRSHERRIELSVRDTGQGIAPEILPHIFEVFTQADRSLDRTRGGLGIGLAMVKGLVQMHGGEVRATSEGVGRGSEISLRLPLAEDVPEEPEQPFAEPAQAEARKILVVEDNPDAAATMRDFLELSGHEVALANSGAEGVETAHQFHPEVVLCDLGLPGMSGYEVAAALRRDPDTASARLIAVTGYGRDEDRRRSKAAGFDVHLTKPVDPRQLRRLLQEA
jgi:signal transduction histidine kinase/CheY-like chemotaxis protein